MLAIAEQIQPQSLELSKENSDDSKKRVTVLQTVNNKKVDLPVLNKDDSKISIEQSLTESFS